MSSFQVIQVVLGVVFFAGLGAFVLWSAFGRIAREKMVLRHPTVPISSFPDGEEASVRGVVRPAEGGVVAPASGVEVVLFRVEFRYDPVQAGHQGGHTTIISEEGGSDFLVEDDTGAVLVRVPEPTDAPRSSLSPGVRKTLSGIGIHAGPGTRYSWEDLGMERWEALLARWGYTHDQLTGGQTRGGGGRVGHYVREWVVPAGATVTARGRGTLRTDTPRPAVELQVGVGTPVDVVRVDP